MDRTARKIQSDNDKKLKVFPQVIDLLARRQNLVFVDEAVFTSKLMSNRVWRYKSCSENFLVKNRSAFKAIAVVAGIDSKGRVVAFDSAETSINRPEFKNLLT